MKRKTGQPLELYTFYSQYVFISGGKQWGYIDVINFTLSITLSTIFDKEEICRKVFLFVTSFAIHKYNLPL